MRFPRIPSPQGVGTLSIMSMSWGRSQVGKGVLVTKEKNKQDFSESDSAIFTCRLLTKADRTHQIVICSPPKRTAVTSLSRAVMTRLLTAVTLLPTIMVTLEHRVMEDDFYSPPLVTSSPLNFPIPWLFLKTYLKREKLAIPYVLQFYFFQFGWHPNTSIHEPFRMINYQRSVLASTEMGLIQQK